MKTRVGRLLISGAILLVGLLILELAFGNWLRPNRMNRLNLIRNARLTHDVSSLYEIPSGRITYIRDQYGLRGHYDNPGAIDILTLGGSATDQRYITEGSTWQDVLSEDFARSGRRVSVVNAGVDGQSTVGHIRDFDWWFPNVPGLKPKFFLYYVGFNDFFTRVAFDELVAAPSLATSIKESSALFGLFLKVRGTYRAMVVAQVGHTAVDFSKLEWTSEPQHADHRALASEWLQRYRDRLRLLLTRTRAAGGTPICVTQPARYYRVDGERVTGVAANLPFNGGSVNGVDYFLIMNGLHDATLEICGEFRGLGIDAARKIEWTDADFYDYVHHTPQGARKLGDYLHSQLASAF